jgi:HD-GYP domain-containing protein (c-di-GMP phosphodiesterase class II)
VARVGDPLLGELKSHDPLEARSAQAREGFLALFDAAVGETALLFSAFQGNKEADPAIVGKLAREAVGGLVQDHDLLVNLHNLQTDYNYLLGHSVGVAVLAVAAAAAHGYNRRLVLEMGYAAYLHDIGMLRIPPEVVGKPGRLSPLEMMEVRRHPVYGLDMLQKLVGRRSGLPAAVPVVAYQSHERENSSGYPKGRGSRLIHDFAKLLAVCDVYQAMISRRPWREPLLPYLAMEQLVLMGGRRDLAPEVVRSLLSFLSLFPVGSWVELSDGALARVVGATGEGRYTRPVVCMLYRDGRPLDKPVRVNLADNPDLEIARPAPAPEDTMDPMEGF